MVSGTISPGENLGRGVFSSSHSRRAKRGIILPNVFLEKEGKLTISVDRLDLTTTDEATSIADRVADARGDDRTFYGWAVIPVDKAQTDRRRVGASPLLGNPYHADIILPPDAATDREVQKVHAQRLADASTWRERSP